MSAYNWQLLAFLRSPSKLLLRRKSDVQDEVRMPVRRIDHILIAMPPGREDEARAFYQGILGLAEKMKPPQLAARGGCWFESETLQVHWESKKISRRRARPIRLSLSMTLRHADESTAGRLQGHGRRANR